MSSRPLILILITKADIGGAQVHVLEILKRLKPYYRFVLASGEDNYLTRQAKILGIETRLLSHLKRPIRLSEDFRGLTECISMLRELNPDLLHIHSSKAGVIGRLAAWREGVPCLFTAHGWAFTEGVPLLRKSYGLVLEFFLARLTGRVITVSEYDYQLAKRYRVGSDSKRYLVKNGISRTAKTKITGRSPILQILTIGRLNATQKNPEMLLEALASLEFPFYARIIGEGECREKLEKKIIALGLNEKVELLGEVTETAEYLAKTDLFVLTSNYEGLPLSVLEAMSLGVPVVATDVGGVNEAVLNEKTGLLSERKNVARFSANLERLASNPDIRKQYGEMALFHYEKNFTADRMVSELQEIYRDLIDGI